ncbi:MAG: molybdate ABC transporter substrate-binding protein [Acidimicrobiales bacterium]
MRRLSAVFSMIAATTAVLASCGDGGTSETPTVAGSIRVFAAASLTDALAEVAAAFEAADPDAAIELSFAGSSSLREQILGGAPADVFASANEANMEQVIEAGEVEASAIFATNRLQVVVPAGNPAGITGLDDLADPDLLIGLCAEEVPCGGLGRQALDAAGVTASPDTNEPDVRALLTKVEVGELDAALVYATDVVAGGDLVEGIDLPAEVEVVTAYPIGVVAGSGNADAARAFVDFVLSDEGQAILDDHGFGRP